MPIGRAWRGFTLLEMMVVLTLMAVTMTVLLKSVSGQQDYARYQVTKERYDLLKKAVLDIANINGIPVFGGFVADVGRLPRNIHELLTPGFCFADFTASTQTDCGENGWIASPLWGRQAVCSGGKPPLVNPPNPPACQDNPATEIQVSMMLGWKGPYLQVSPSPTHVDSAGGSDAFADGWGNVGSKDDFYSQHNYGWYMNKNGSAQANYNPLCSPTGAAVDANDCLTVFSYGNGCYRDESLCKGTSASPDPLDFSFPPSSSPASIGMAYDANLKLALIPDPNQAGYYAVAPPSGTWPALPVPLIRPMDWMVELGNTGVNVLVAATPCLAGTCPAAQGIPPTRLCLNLYYNQQGQLAVVSSDVSSLNPLLLAEIPETGQVIMVHFAFPDEIENKVEIPVGNAAFSIHRGACAPITSEFQKPTPRGTTGDTYPFPKRQAVPVQILPGQTPSFVW